MIKKLSTYAATLLLSALLVMTSAQISFAESSLSENNAHDAITQVASQSDAYAVQIQENDKEAYIEGATFAVSDFSRALKGSPVTLENSPADYAYYQGKSADYVVAVVTDTRIIAYVPPRLHALADISDETSRCELIAYIKALDIADEKRKSAIDEHKEWIFTSDPEYRDNDVTYFFDTEVKNGAYYVCLAYNEGTESALSTSKKSLPAYVDFLRVVPPNQVSIVAPATGIAAFIEFLQGIDYSPLWVTLKTTGCAIIFIFVLGLAAAYMTMRVSKRARDIFDTIFTIPMVLPPTVCGFLLLLLLGKNTSLGQWFIDIGFPLVFSWPATVIAATVVAFPLMYRSSRGAFENLDPNMLDAARTLGWSNARIFFKLMIPLTWSSIAAATVLAFARALGEFGATLFLAGNYVGITRTIPIAIYFEWMGGNTDVAIFWTIIIIIFSFLVILFINLWSRRTTTYRRRTDDK